MYKLYPFNFKWIYDTQRDKNVFIWFNYYTGTL